MSSGRIEHEHVTCRAEVARPECVGDAAARAVPHGAQEVVAACKLREHAPAVVHGAVVDHDHFVVHVRRLGEGFGGELHEQRQVLRFVHGGNQDADFEWGVGRGE